MDDYLMHWGIKGMKWGVRRYQNADGTLTEEGKARYGTGTSPIDKKNRFKRIATGAGAAAGVAAGVVAGRKAYQSHKAKAGTSQPKEQKEVNPDIFKPGKDGKPSPVEKGARATKDAIDSTKGIYNSAKKLSRREERAKQAAKERAKIKAMSDEELRKRINRLDMERRYRQLTAEDTAEGESAVNDILAIAGNVAAIGVSAATLITLLKQAKG